jgi:hypothetical protein
MTWEEAITRLIGHHDWWLFDYHCRESNPDVTHRTACREAAIKAAQTRTPVSIEARAAGVSVGCCGQILPG